MPSTPYDVKGLLKSSIRDDNPIIFIEHMLLYNEKGPVPEEEYLVPIGKADIRREGKDVTIVATSRMVLRSLKAAETLAQDGIEAEVIDPRTLVPLDEETILQSVKKTGKLVIVHEACKRSGYGAEIAATVAEKAFYDLDAPIKRVAAANTPVPFAPKLENFVIPDEQADRERGQGVIRIGGRAGPMAKAITIPQLGCDDGKGDDHHLDETGGGLRQ